MARTTKNFGDSIRNELAKDDDIASRVAEEYVNARIAAQIANARQEAGLSQKQLAQKIGTHQSSISRIEDADYEGHSVSTLTRIASALGCRLRVEFYQESKNAAPARSRKKRSG